mmetsp:Transcript_147444/g.383324  ORF Transcript_147444/g.383324 Transcript_147444/m.383324 type:complete len:354 (+) Transcript_147444:310-1371(+)
MLKLGNAVSNSPRCPGWIWITSLFAGEAKVDCKAKESSEGNAHEDPHELDTAGERAARGHGLARDCDVAVAILRQVVNAVLPVGSDLLNNSWHQLAVTCLHKDALTNEVTTFCMVVNGCVCVAGLAYTLRWLITNTIASCRLLVGVDVVDVVHCLHWLPSLEGVTAVNYVVETAARTHNMGCTRFTSPKCLGATTREAARLVIISPAATAIRGPIAVALALAAVGEACGAHHMTLRIFVWCSEELQYPSTNGSLCREGTASVATTGRHHRHRACQQQRRSGRRHSGCGPEARPRETARQAGGRRCREPGLHLVVGAIFAPGRRQPRIALAGVPALCHRSRHRARHRCPRSKKR